MVKSKMALHLYPLKSHSLLISKSREKPGRQYDAQKQLNVPLPMPNLFVPLQLVILRTIPICQSLPWMPPMCFHLALTTSSLARGKGGFWRLGNFLNVTLYVLEQGFNTKTVWFDPRVLTTQNLAWKSTCWRPPHNCKHDIGSLFQNPFLDSTVNMGRIMCKKNQCRKRGCFPRQHLCCKAVKVEVLLWFILSLTSGAWRMDSQNGLTSSKHCAVGLPFSVSKDKAFPKSHE